VNGMIKLVIPGIPPNLNKWRNMHHHEEARQKREWEEIVWLETLAQNIKPAMPIKKARVNYTFFFESNRRHDPTNCYGSVKWLEDGLVYAGVLEDDSFDNVKNDVEKGGVDKHNPRVVITIEELL
jgi:Holliday junction resolvase RusA-like endonuclease